MKTNLLVHKHLIVRAESKRPPKDEEHITDWMRDFVDSIGMKVLMGPYAKYLDVPGNRGLTVAAIMSFIWVRGEKVLRIQLRFWPHMVMVSC